MTCRTGGCRQAASLSALLHEAADELLGILLEHVVDLVEDRVDVVVELLLALGVDLGGLGLRLGLARLAGALVLLFGHVPTLSPRGQTWVRLDKLTGER